MYVIIMCMFFFGVLAPTSWHSTSFMKESPQCQAHEWTMNKANYVTWMRDFSEALQIALLYIGYGTIF
jgi:hypothetical protein